MTYCPKQAPAFGVGHLSDEHAAAWCRRVYHVNLPQCQGCELAVKYGVVAEELKPCGKGDLPVQGRLF